MSTRLPGFAALIAALTACTAAAQSVPQRVTVPFEFTAGKTVLPAGRYDVSMRDSEARYVRINNGKSAAEVAILTRLDQRGDVKTVRFVFDKIGETSFLSEIWMPGSQGLMVRATAVPHQHKAVEGEK